MIERKREKKTPKDEEENKRNRERERERERESEETHSCCRGSVDEDEVEGQVEGLNRGGRPPLAPLPPSPLPLSERIKSWSVLVPIIRTHSTAPVDT